jgi:hypothetical protein
VAEPPFPAALVVSHPNRYGAGEDLSGFRELADRFGARVYVDVDPLLSAEIDLPDGVVRLTDTERMPNEILARAGGRARLAADALERRLRQVRGLEFPVAGPIGRTVTVVLPIPGRMVQEALAGAGALVAVSGPWDGVTLFTAGWWHTRRQIEGLVAAVSAILVGEEPLPIPADTLDRVPADLPARRLGTITPFL